MSLTAFVQAFHFLRPLWLLALPVLLLLVWWLARRRARDGDWSKLIDADLLAALRLDGDHKQASGKDRPWPWLALAWALAVLALAGPSWQQDMAPAYRAPAAWVVVLDLSPSMAAGDVAPSRATRARYAVDDLLGAVQDARVGMIAFSDEAYTVTPLTQDVGTIRALLPSLAPDMMPTPGDNLAPALEQAQKLLDKSGAKDKRIVVLSDGFADQAASMAAVKALAAKGVVTSVVAVGTAGGAPLRDADGNFAKDAQGRPVLARMDTASLQELAKVGGGQYVELASVPRLISTLQNGAERGSDAVAENGVSVAHWLDAGAFLLPALLLLVALLSRRRWL